MHGLAGNNALLVAETAQQLQVGLQLLGRLQPFTITLVKDMSVPASSWPKGIVVDYAMVLEGLPPPAPRTILDLYQVRGHAVGGASASLCHSLTCARMCVCSLAFALRDVCMPPLSAFVCMYICVRASALRYMCARTCSSE